MPNNFKTIMLRDSVVCFKICADGVGNRVYNYEHMGPYGWTDDIWIGYEDYQSLVCKVNLCRFRAGSLKPNYLTMPIITSLRPSCFQSLNRSKV